MDSDSHEVGIRPNRIERIWIVFFKTVGRNVTGLLEYLGGLTQLFFETVRVALRYRFPLRAFIEACEFVGVKTLGVVSLIGIFTGMVMALQFVVGLSRFGLKTYTGQLIGVAITREIAPVLSSIMVAARVGSGIAAEIGSMVVTEQVLAIQALGANPVNKLVLPRVLATTLSTPILATFANVIGILGGLWITSIEAGVTARFFMDQIQRTVHASDYFSGIVKTLFFGFFVGLISCYEGLRTEGGTAGVGRSTTRAVVYSSLTIVVADFFLTKLFLLM